MSRNTKASSHNENTQMDLHKVRKVLDARALHCLRVLSLIEAVIYDHGDEGGNPSSPPARRFFKPQTENRGIFFMIHSRQRDCEISKWIQTIHHFKAWRCLHAPALQTQLHISTSIEAAQLILRRAPSCPDMLRIAAKLGIQSPYPMS